MIKGIDISHYQNDKGSIDWAKVRSAGYDFVYIKASEGVALRDSFYNSNINDARKAGLIVGSYHFARANDAVKEADYFLATVGEMKQYDFLVLDWEIESSDPDGWCRTFLDRCFEKTGVRPLLYTNADRVSRIKWTKVVAGSYGLIVARYGDNDAVLEDNEIASPDEFPFVVIQQFTSNMTVPGITGRVDANVGNLTIETLKKYGKQPADSTTPNTTSAVSQATTQGTINVEAELAKAIEYAHGINISDGFTPEKQRLVASRETELKKSEMFARGTLDKLRGILNS